MTFDSFWLALRATFVAVTKPQHCLSTFNSGNADGGPASPVSATSRHRRTQPEYNRGMVCRDALMNTAGALK
jgi:hypothetical protein